MPVRLASFALALLFVFTACRRPPDPLPGFPRLVLWAWERPENLSYLVPSATGVAYLAETISFTAGKLERSPRMQPLIVPPHTPAIAVIRIEPHGTNRPPVEMVAAEILRATKRAPIRALQIDFDARASERTYYRALLAELRRDLPPRVALEITALVSWCESDDWIHRLPISAAIPMFFQMGADPHSTSEHLREPLCQSSAGISTSEFYVTIPRVQRVFVFNTRPWTESNYRAVLKASKKWFSH